MPTSVDTFVNLSLDQQSAQQLTAHLRRSSNRMEMLLNPDLPHHSDEPERLRVRALSASERESLRHDAMQIIHAVRAEIRRRSQE